MLFRDCPPETRTLLGAQLVFNLGFFAVIPFLAGAMRSDYGLGAAAVGLVLGARTFSQQGMFLLGGILADRWGARRSILTGCLVRISGYATLLGASDLPLFLLGAVLTGAGGALFSPALEAQLSHADQPAPPGTKRRSVFVWLAITGEIGAVLGPLLGSALLGWGFDAALTAGIAVFAAVTVLLWWRLPAPPARTDTAPADTADTAGRRPSVPSRPALGCLRDRRFLAFCALGSVNLLAYNQLYFAIPVELERRGLGQAWLGGLFLLASVLTLTLQLPVAGLARRVGSGPTLSAGFALLAAAFAVAAGTAVHPGGPTAEAVAPVLITVAVLVLGHMALTPTILSLVPEFLHARDASGQEDASGRGNVSGRGAYYGLVATCGGIAVLVGNTVLGRLVDATDRFQWWAGTPWAPLVLLALLSAVAIPRMLPDRRPPGTSASPSIEHHDEKAS
ncbi:MFS transporter [Kocuria sp. M1N1S27]|uniref:MFS transporter n=1 Tax=Kocuria kalidii TaxID=3376283 RepID=UPI00379736BB